MNGDILTAIILPAAGVLAAMLSWGIISAVLTLLARQREQAEAEALGPPADADPAHLAPIAQAALNTKTAKGCTIATPLIFGAVFGGLVPTQVVTSNTYNLIGFAACGMLVWCLAAWRWRTAVRRQREIQWQHDARTMVDKVVQPLADRGYHVFQNFTVEDIAVDYLLVGPKGIFALQLLVRAVDADIEHRPDATVTYDGRTLFFPQGKDYESIEAADGQAERLSDWLSERLETPVAARAILALPGWQVKRISADGISVINPSQLEALFQYIKPRPLEAVEVSSIVKRIARHHGEPPGDHNITSLSENAL